MIDAFEPGYSAPVSLELHLGTEILGVSKVGPDRIVLDKARAVRDGEADLVIKIGKLTKRRPIILTNSNAIDGTVNYF